MVIGELYEEWHNSYLGRRAERVRNAKRDRLESSVQAAEYGNAAPAAGATVERTTPA
jgi:hypothetical protein